VKIAFFALFALNRTKTNLNLEQCCNITHI
jgi:hypothetical protein